MMTANLCGFHTQKGKKILRHSQDHLALMPISPYYLIEHHHHFVMQARDENENTIELCKYELVYM